MIVGGKMANRVKHVLTQDEKHILERHHISKDVFTSRLRKGWSRERALTQPVKKRQSVPYLTKDEQHLMIQNGVTYSILKTRLNQGWSKAYAIQTPYRPKRKTNPYRQFSDLEKHYMVEHFVTPQMYQNRRHLGWTRDEAIFIPKDIKRHEIYRNKLYPITAEELSTICRNGSTVDTYRMRRHLGWSKEEAINTPK